ncbi:MAG TPA: hypothetical protein VGE38_07065 [Nocardioides sp.]|uniref:hypothetical protein n=1 Tax=Nocardioides sp. TaxID=35761 RepID=UPI002ED9DB68
MKPPPHVRNPTPSHVVDADDQVLEVGGHCGLYIDLQPEDSAPMRGDWVATEAGSRYLVDDVRLVRSRRHAQVNRYQMQVLRLPKHAVPPADVHVIWLRWYPRGRRS